MRPNFPVCILLGIGNWIYSCDVGIDGLTHSGDTTGGKVGNACTLLLAGE
jgi:hypothetical protein